MEFMNRPNPDSGLGGHSSDIPDLVQFSDIPEASGSVRTLGIGVSGPVGVALDGESPHILVYAPTNKGKSTVGRSLGVPSLSPADLVVVLDRKMHSHQWARDLAPVVPYRNTTPPKGFPLCNLGQETP